VRMHQHHSDAYVYVSAKYMHMYMICVYVRVQKWQSYILYELKNTAEKGGLKDGALI